MIEYLMIGLVLFAVTTPSKKMPGGLEWTTENLNLETEESYCYDDLEVNCRRYGRLYTWASANRVCRSLGRGWRLPTTEDWREMARHFGGLRDESADLGKAAYTALVSGGSSGFNAVLGGGHGPDGYARLNAHGLYWTATQTGQKTAWVYNFGKGGQSVGRHRNLEKTRALSVRCVKD